MVVVVRVCGEDQVMGRLLKGDGGNNKNDKEVFADNTENHYPVTVVRII